MITSPKNESVTIPSLTVAALRGGSGKTIVSLSITHALARSGMKVTCFKKGPDYIDAAWLAKASGGPCYNLDPFLMEEATIKDSFALRSRESDIAIVEGNRGLYDGMDIEGTSSTARLSTMLNVPILLVVDCTKSTRTVAALVLGCIKFEPGLNFIGVVLNRIAGPRHRKIVTKAIETYTGLPVLGFIPRLKQDPLPMRHLGLTPTDEFSGPSQALKGLAELAEKHINLGEIVSICNQTPATINTSTDIKALFKISGATSYRGLKLGIMRDAAFQFYYPENLEALELLGAELIYLNGLTDKDIPNIDGLYIGGGFPETQAATLETNKTFRKRLLNLIEKGLPVYAECGGLMYLGRSINWNNQDYEMVGALPFHFEMKKRPAGHGYTTLQFEKDSPFYSKGAVIKGHEFHYSKPLALNERDGVFACKVIRGSGFDGKHEGYVFKNTFSTYTHIHALGQKEWASTFLKGVARR